MSLNIDIKIILPVKVSGISSNFNSKSVTSWQSCNVVNPGKIFHSNSIGSPSILSKVLYSGELLNHVNLPSHATLDCGFSFIFPRHNIESEKTWTFVRWRLMICSSPINDKYFHDEFSHLVQTPILQICRTFVTLWGLLYFWSVNFLSNSSPHEHRCLQCRKHKHSPFHRMFFVVFCNIHRRSFLSLPHLIIHQLSTLEKTKLCHRPILSSVLSTRFQQIVCGGALARDCRHGRQRVAPFYHITQLSHSRETDLHGFSSPGFLTSRMTDSRESLQ